MWAFRRATNVPGSVDRRLRPMLFRRRRSDGPHRRQHPHRLQDRRPPEGEGLRRGRQDEDFARAASHRNGTAIVGFQMTLMT